MRALILDYDGVIVDSETCLARVAIDLLERRGAEAAFADIARFVGGNCPRRRRGRRYDTRRSRASGPDADEAFYDWLAGLLGSRSGVESFEALLSERAEPMLAALEPTPGVVELIDDAHEGGWKVGLGTGAARAPLEKALIRMRLHDRFDAVVTAGDVGRGKPAPDVFLEVARQLGIEPVDCVVVEDSLPGYTAAIAAGMAAIACPCALTASTSFPLDARVVGSLDEIDLNDL